MAFLWIKLLHIVAMTSWMAGIFYLPRIFVHYVEGQEAGQDCSRLEIMARKLFGFMSLMAVFTLLFGCWLWLGFGFKGGWIQAKLAFVGLLLGYHAWCYVYLQRMLSQSLHHSGRYFRWFNELPLLLFIPILYFVLMKPF